MTSKVTIEAINEDVEYRIVPEIARDNLECLTAEDWLRLSQRIPVSKGQSRELLIHSGRSILIREVSA